MNQATGKFEWWRAANGEWRFRLKAPNGRIICQSEGYKSKRGCLNGIKSIKACAARAQVIEVLK